MPLDQLVDFGAKMSAVVVSGVRGQRSGVGGQGSGVRGQGSEVRGQGFQG